MTTVLVQGQTWDWNGGMHPVFWMWSGGWLIMLLFMLVFWGLVIAGLVVGLRWLLAVGRHPASGDRAVAILRERYARGEIGKEEFEAKLRDLR